MHGVPGVVGALFIGFGGTIGGLVYGGNGRLLAWQFIAALSVSVYAAIVTYALAKVVEFCCGGLRVTDRGEEAGLDVVEHGEQAHHLLDPITLAGAAATDGGAAFGVVAGGGGGSARDTARSMSDVDDSVGSLQSRTGQIDALRQALLQQLPPAASGR